MAEKKKAIAEALAGVGVHDYLLIGFHTISEDAQSLQSFWQLNYMDLPTFVNNLGALFEKNPAVAHLVGSILKFGEIRQRLAEVQARIVKEEGKA